MKANEPGWVELLGLLVVVLFVAVVAVLVLWRIVELVAR